MVGPRRRDGLRRLTRRKPSTLGSSVFFDPGVSYGDAPSRGIGVQLLSGLNCVMDAATSAVFGPRLRCHTSPS